MKKLYTLMALVAMLIVPMTAGAWSYDLLEENTVLQNEDYHLELSKNYNFYSGLYNGEPMVDAASNRVSGDGCLSQSADKAAFKLNKNDAYQVVSPVCMQNFYLQIGTGAINLRANINKTGLHNYGSGSRFFAIADMKAGQVIVCQWGVSSGSGVVQPSSAISGATACTWTDITEEIHSAQAAEIDPETGEPKTPDYFSYWKVETDGFFVIEMQRYSSIQGLQIWVDAGAAEYVTAPVYTMMQVDYTTRYGEVKDGTSSKGLSVTTWYSFDGTDPIFLVETDEVESEETVDVVDETGTVIDQQTIVTYKKVLQPDEFGFFGENQYFSDEGLMFDENDDYDGDGYVELKIASVSESGKAYSDIVTYKVAINTITLNPPTLTLVGIDGVNRSYQIGWNNNTLCHENVFFTAECDGNLVEGLGIGEVLTAADNIKVTVEAAGYENGVYELQEVLNKGVEMFRKNSEKAEVGEHDWDFVITDDNVKRKIKGEEILYCYLEEDPDTHFTAEEYEIGESYQGQDLSAAIPVKADYGWDWDAGNNRATLRVLKSKDEQNNDVLIEGGFDCNEAGFGYAEDKMGILNNNGLSISCPPNAKNNSCILQYVDKGEQYLNDGVYALGLYFMARPTLTFDRNAAEYGDFVLVYQGQGGSNYTSTRWPSIYEVPSNELLTFQLANNGIHLFYIDVFTSEKDDNYEDPYVTGVTTIPATTMSSGFVYTLDGRVIRRNAETNGLQRGMYILNGKKILVK